ncbi:MAG: hypothetical protein AAF934_12130 [Bacteroidota bacterium]
MKIPKFLLGDNTAYPDAVFVIHTDYPRFIINVVTDEIEWLEAVDLTDENESKEILESLVLEAIDFYDNELKNYEV